MHIIIWLRFISGLLLLVLLIFISMEQVIAQKTSYEENASRYSLQEHEKINSNKKFISCEVLL
ncbi:MAG: Unknown protein [uncultured Sulfurovum sp.]|uniref:Uncharacterized protein n=1 Tax=uncultured Sulfurovum sp. TaxID=269237 RepID=A0A6S6SUF2_9BACT|nr:MAG: Unknown protein [uncultured Sulfurovum sp.]